VKLDLVKLATLLFFLMSISNCSEATHNSREEQNADGYEKLTPNFTSIQNRVFQSQCVRCHAGDEAEGGYDLSSYENIMSEANVPPLVVPGFPEKSLLYQSVADGSMPDGGPALNARALKAISDWILAGALP